MISDLWYKHGLIYNFSLSGFLDTDGDGIGDLEGALQRIDYLQGLGVTSIWLAPFQPSPMRDHGYDICDYYGVDPRYGSLGDFVEFSRACKQRGLRLIMDLVVNHCSDQHPWFRKAIEDPSSEYFDYFIWADEEPEKPKEGVIFPGVQETTWTYNEQVGKYYFHRFYEFQPDLNMANPKVQREVLKIVGFWLELGISGFRIDAVPFLIAQEGINVEDPEPAYALLRNIRALAQWRKGDAVLLAEANIPAEKAVKYFGEDGERLHMILNFPVNQTLFYALATGDTLPLREKLEASKCVPFSAQWANFLRNHDELDIGRLPKEQKEAVFSAFGPEEEMQIYGRGIRRRLSPMLGGDCRRVKLANSLLMTLPGTPVIRYGDEIGMGEDLSLPERESVRTPMQWSEGPNGGFTSSDNPIRPPIDGGPYGFQLLNVAQQRTEGDSLLNWMERVIRMRKEMPEIGEGEYRILDTPASILALRYQWEDHLSLFLHNFENRRREVFIDLDVHSKSVSHMTCVLNHQRYDVRADGTYRIIVEPYGYHWLRAGGLEALPKESIG
jgi:maltose alpha-D-glucosyltransferase/alpha-amylase|tara:strand:- start:20889 stop:22550 length:1662 start_codon:yes stop_codon:yes gene_type:complete